MTNYLRTFDDVCNWFIFPYPTISFDTETTGLNYDTLEIEGISFCAGEHICCYIDLLDNPEKENILTFIRNLFKEHFTFLIGCNLPFDLKVLKKYNIFPSEKCNFFDVQIAANLLNENEPKGLKYLARFFVDMNMKDYKTVEKYDHHSEDFYDYAIQDAIAPWKLAAMFYPKLKLEGLLDLFKTVEMPFIRSHVSLETNGVMIDQAKLITLQDDLQQIINKLLIEMCELTKTDYYYQETFDWRDRELITEINFNSSQQLIKLIKKKLGIKIQKETENGNPSVGVDSLKDLKDEHPFIEVLLKYKKAQKLWSSFVSTFQDFIDSDGRIRCNYSNIRAVTGRVTSSNPNLLQLPRPNDDIKLPYDFRACFTTTGDKKIVTADYSGQEICWLGEVTQDKNLINDIKRGKDIHLTVAKTIFDLNIPDECLLTSNKDYSEFKNKYYSERHRAKNGVVFPIIYGKTSYGIAKEFNISEEEANRWIDSLFKLYPGVKKSIAACHAQIDKNKEVSDWFGRKRRFLITDDKSKYRAYRQGFNFLIQSPSASQMKKAITEVEKKFTETPHWKAKVLLMIYDELVYEIDKNYVDISKEVVSNIMVKAVETTVPFSIETGIGDNYAEAK